MTKPAPGEVTRAVTSEIRTRLDQVEKLAPRRGKLDLGAYVRGTRAGGNAGGMLDYEHRVSPSAVLFGTGSLGYGYGQTPGLNYETQAGLRVRW